MAGGSEPRPFLDRPAARIVAAVVFLACLAALAWLERGRFMSAGPAAPAAPGDETGADDPFARCFAERAADIERMIAEGVVDDQQAQLFRERAEAMCRAEAGGGSSAPGLPPPQ